MIAGVLPVKSPADSMHRLSALFSPGEREELARKLFHQALATLSVVSGLDVLIVVAKEPSFIEAARHRGACVLEEADQVSHSQSAECGVEMALGLGTETVLSAPIDVPLATAADYAALLETARGIPAPGLIIIPSFDGTGTNALVRKPPGVIASQFGPGSFEKHLGSGQAAGAEVHVSRPNGITLDLDTPQDLLEIDRHADRNNDVLDYLGSIDAFGRARTVGATPLA